MAAAHPDPLSEARQLLGALTPLTGDCGQLCGAACCHSLEGEETGMLLFPGEERFYAGKDGYRILEKGGRSILLCPGRCERSERPLSCRLFPLLPVIRGDAVRVTVDARSRVICPLSDEGLSGFSEAFRSAVRSAGQVLMADPRQKDFLLRLTEEQDTWRALQRSLTGGQHV